MKRNRLCLWALSIGLIIAPLGVLLNTGCNKSTLEPGGAYNPTSTDTNGVQTGATDMPLFLADTSYKLAWTTVNAAFETEKENRQFLWSLSPAIKHSLDNIRPQATQANLDFAKARKAYIDNPIPANLTTVQSVLSKMQQLATAAQAALPKGP